MSFECISYQKKEKKVDYRLEIIFEIEIDWHIANWLLFLHLQELKFEIEIAILSLQQQQATWSAKGLT